MERLLLKTPSVFLLYAPLLLSFGIGIGWFFPSEQRLEILLSLGVFLSLFYKKHPLILSVFCALIMGWVSFSYQQRILTPQISSSLNHVTITGTLESFERKDHQAHLVVKLQSVTPFLGALPKKLKVFAPYDKVQFLDLFSKITFKGDLWPLPKPYTPYNYPLKRQLLFQGIGGYARLGSLEAIEASPSKGVLQSLSTLRQRLSEQLYAHLKKYDLQAAAIADALLTGKRQDIHPSIRQHYVQAGIAHVLAISGLHLSLVAGFVFLLLRRGLIPLSFLFFQGLNLKKVAAVGVILLTAFYVVISGMGYPALRAFVMISMAMVGILLDRQGLTLRFLALSATFILLIDPHSLFSISFQLSFAAVLALVAFYETIQNLWDKLLKKGFFYRVIGYFLGITLSSVLATLATLPYTVVHFHQFTLQAILGNLIAIPLMGFWIMPLLFLCCFSLLVGGWDFGFYLLYEGIYSLTQSAQFVSLLPGSKIILASPSLWFLPLFSIGFVLLSIGNRRIKTLGVAVILLSLFFLKTVKKPFVLASNQAKEIAYITDDTLWILKGRENSFAIKSWVETWDLKEVKKIPLTISKIKHVLFIPYPFENKQPYECSSASIVLSNGYLDTKCATNPWRVDKAGPTHENKIRDISKDFR
ncbi:MAG TPA: ComEC/Rec2 family competence protein [Alphaproteobacteria bacterium]|nr:ComEC/Rec2 family competence protein [Alphaproteobacteria bacterium]